MRELIMSSHYYDYYSSLPLVVQRMNKDKILSANELLNKKYGTEGSESRSEFNKKAMAYYYGVLLRNKRKELCITQNELAEKSGTTRSYIARIEKGQTDMQVSTFIKILSALGLELSITQIA